MSWKRISKFVVVVWVVLALILVWVFRYTAERVWSLTYPDEPQRLYLQHPQKLIVKRGIIDDEYVYGLGAGYYQEVLANEKGSFYLAPPRGFYKKAIQGVDGYAVGGIYYPSDNEGVVYVWEYPLKNHERTLDNPNTSRQLSLDYDQPEREWFLDSTWYESKDFKLLGWPLIDTDFTLPVSHFQNASQPRSAVSPK